MFILPLPRIIIMTRKSNFFANVKQFHVPLKLLPFFHTGIFLLSAAVLIVNEDLSEGLSIQPRQSYISLVLLNVLSLLIVLMLHDGLGYLLFNVDSQGASLVSDTCFLTSTYRMAFLLLDSIYYLYRLCCGERKKAVVQFDI